MPILSATFDESLWAPPTVFTFFVAPLLGIQGPPEFPINRRDAELL